MTTSPTDGPGEVLIVGSCNVDVSIFLAQIPRPGETVLGDYDRRGLGGKGANQAFAAARAGVATAFLGAVGDDGPGQVIRDGFAEAGIDTSLRTVDVQSGTAYVMVEHAGENAIVVVSGANGLVADLTEAEQERIGRARVVLLQLEIPVPTVAQAAAVARAAGATVVLNAAPFLPLPAELLADLDVLMVNEHEAAGMVGHDGTPEELAAALLELVPQVVVTLGGAGSLYRSAETGVIRTPAPKVDVVDTTAAGDTFAGAYGAALVEGRRPADALRFASTAAALAVQKQGAVPSIPDRAAIDKALALYY